MTHCLQPLKFRGTAADHSVTNYYMCAKALVYYNKPLLWFQELFGLITEKIILHLNLPPNSEKTPVPSRVSSAFSLLQLYLLSKVSSLQRYLLTFNHSASSGCGGMNANPFSSPVSLHSSAMSMAPLIAWLLSDCNNVSGSLLLWDKCGSWLCFPDSSLICSPSFRLVLDKTCEWMSAGKQIMKKLLSRQKTAGTRAWYVYTYKFISCGATRLDRVAPALSPPAARSYVSIRTYSLSLKGLLGI